ncbi:type II secretion system minor pseudopilin GspI [Sphingomonas sp. LaA6.9]|uniref:type II secretion system minor pseudopilin GspI n=1 Tax=Sphingomonas sp. LaA6.9 TaxID=2919914 RepID=UPI001F4F67AB|nr:type II secretion system minor pseudopilin GspI [Sphingomonas sp. LaA6.9]MCJ8157592.1 type II secretion system minor pseudopilin GspI [Sphingomonas sp. LaA6.9]
MSDRESGFTLIEMLVALAVFSLAALALMRLEGATLSSTADLDQKLIAQIVARNVAVETLTDPTAPALGETSGEETNAGRRWRWQRRTTRPGDQRIVRIDISVLDMTGRNQAGLTVVRQVK